MLRFVFLLLINVCEVSTAMASVFSEDINLALQSLLNDHADFSDEGGVALTVFKGDHRFDGAAGFANRLSRQPMAMDAQFRVGSNTKMVLATIVFQLIEEGRLSLEDKFGKFVSGYPSWADIQVHNLLGMSSGITEYMRVPLVNAALTFAPRSPRSIRQILDFVKDEPLRFVPGQSCLYSNTNYMALGLLIEAVTGKNIADVVDQRIVRPLGLQSTFMETGEEPLQRLVRGYLDVGLAAAVWGVSPALYVVFDQHERLGDDLVDATEHFHPSVAGPAGALISTTADMVKILQSLMRGRLISQQSLATMLEVQPCKLADQVVQYGKGVFRWRSSIGDIYGHGGLTFGYRSGAFYQLEHDIFFAMMGNYYPDQLDPVSDEMLQILVGQVNPPLTQCHVDDDYFALEQDDTLNIRFRGQVVKHGESPRLGIGMIKVRRNGRLFKLHTKELKAEFQQDNRIIVSGLGTRKNSEHGLLRTRLYIPTDVKPTLENVLATVEEISVDSKTGKIRRACISGVNDSLSWPRANIRACDVPNQIETHQSNFLRIFARIPTTSRLEEISRTLGALGRNSACVCYAENGESYECRP